MMHFEGLILISPVFSTTNSEPRFFGAKEWASEENYVR